MHSTESIDAICSNSDVEKMVLAVIKTNAAKCHLKKFETPMSIKLVSDVLWTPETGLVTSSFKLKRKNIETRYITLIDSMYSE